MATYEIQATLTVCGGKIRSRKDALTELQIMLGSYDDMNDCDSSVCIHTEKIKKVEQQNSKI